jgi:hypothetical protein
MQSASYSRAYSTRVAEVTDPGTPREHELPVGKDRGLLWRLFGYWFYEERCYRPSSTASEPNPCAKVWSQPAARF